jgi:hypothetical protein
MSLLVPCWSISQTFLQAQCMVVAKLVVAVAFHVPENLNAEF